MNAALGDNRPEVKDFRREVDHLFLRMLFAKPQAVLLAREPDMVAQRNRLQRPSAALRDFDGAHLFLDSATRLVGDDTVVWVDGKPMDVDKGADVRIVSLSPEGHLQFTRCRFEPPSRKYPNVKGECIAVIQVGWITAGDKWKSCEFAAGYSGERAGGMGVWSSARSHASALGSQAIGGQVLEVDEDASRIASIAIGMQFNLRYQWSVLIGFGDMPRVRLTTDPEGVRSVFQFRERMSDEARRAALVHWVQSHWRRARGGNASKAVVEAYLRGKTNFDWNGMRCEIVPSEYDLEQYQKGKLP